MSSLIDSILELLLSWVRGILNDVWNMFSGDSGSFFAWLGRHWLSLVCILLISGITIDLIVYILRWNPQRVWFSKFNRLWGRTAEENTFISGYETGIDSFELDSDPELSEYINEAPQLEQYEAGIAASVDAVPQPEITAASETTVRRRRSDRHAKRGHKRLINLKLPALDENAASYTAYPAPPVPAREAFHNAVYPSDNPELWHQQSLDNNHANK